MLLKIYQVICPANKMTTYSEQPYQPFLLCDSRLCHFLHILVATSELRILLDINVMYCLSLLGNEPSDCHAKLSLLSPDSINFALSFLFHSRTEIELKMCLVRLPSPTIGHWTLWSLLSSPFVQILSVVDRCAFMRLLATIFQCHQLWCIIQEKDNFLIHKLFYQFAIFGLVLPIVIQVLYFTSFLNIYTSIIRSEDWHS